MSSLTLHKWVCNCPRCFAENTLVSESLPPRTQVFCSNCGAAIGTVADMREAFIPFERVDLAVPASVQ